MISTRTNRPILIGGIFLALVMPVMADDQVGIENIGNLSKRLIELRGKVDDLSSELALRREEYRQQAKVLYARKSETQAELERQKGLVKRLQKKLEDNKQRLAQAGLSDARLTPVVLAAAEHLGRQIEQGLPYKREERLADVHELMEQVKSGVVPASKAAARLWALIEDELRLRRENGLFKQVIDLEGSQLLAEVARVGMVMMYFRTSDGRIGKVSKSREGKWRYTTLTDKSHTRQIEELMDAFRKQVRSGYFELPNALVQSEVM